MTAALQRRYDCELCGLTFDADPGRPTPRWCPEDREEGRRRARLARQTDARSGSTIPVHQALALTVVEQRLAIVLAMYALTLAALARHYHRDDRAYLDAALDALARVRPSAGWLIPAQRVGS